MEGVADSLKNAASLPAPCSLPMAMSHASHVPPSHATMHAWQNKNASMFQREIGGKPPPTMGRAGNLWQTGMAGRHRKGRRQGIGREGQ